MENEITCPIHGPFDASLGACPFCSGQSQSPPAPDPLDADNLETDLSGGMGREYYPQAEDDLQTDLNYRGGQQAVEEDDWTEISRERIGPGGFIDLDDEGTTQLGRGRKDDVTEVEYMPTAAIGILWVKSGNRRGQILKINDGDIIGRSEGNVILDDPKVSNPHAKFTVEENQFVLWDFGSKNGTYVNGERIRAATELNENDEIKIGDTIFVFKFLPKLENQKTVTVRYSN